MAVPGNTVRVRVGLPATWNGKFYFQGIGGLGGTIGNLDDGPGPRLRLGVDRHRPRRRRSDLGQQSRQGDRLRPSRHARHRRGGQGARPRRSTASRRARLLQRLLERRAAGDDGSAALSRRTSTASSPAIRPPARRCRPAAPWSSSTCWRRRPTTCRSDKVELLSSSTLAACDAQGRPGRRAHLRSAPLRLRSRVADVRRRRRARLPHARRRSTTVQADLRRR